jgi:hypothetical protein
LPLPELTLQADSQYFIRLSCDAKRPEESVTVLTNALPEAYARDAKGDFCFRLAFLSDRLR